jgi:trehalose/maltose transport system substrate-binding protein
VSSTVTVNNPAVVRAMERVRRWVGTIVPYDVTQFAEQLSHEPFLAGNAIFMRNWP